MKKIKVNKEKLFSGYRGEVDGKLLPHQIIKTVINESKTFLLGDGFEKKVKVEAIDSEEQASINNKLEEADFYRVLNSAVTDGLVYEGYIDYSDTKLRCIPSEDVTLVYYDPSNPFIITYLRENRRVYDPTQNSYNYINVEHKLTLNDNASLLDSEEEQYIYVKKVEGKEEEVSTLNTIPIARLVLELDGIDAISLVEPLIHNQLEYNDVRARLHESNKQHKPQMYSIGSSMPKVIGRTSRVEPQPIDTPSGATIFQTSYDTAQSSIIHLEISNNARDAGIQPRLGYAQPVDSPILDRQIDRILQEVYDNSGVVTFLELQNARSASSSSSLSVLYEPLLRRTRKRAENLIVTINIILKSLGINNYRVKLPNMMPKNIEAEKLELEKVKNKVISRKTFLLQSGLTEEQAAKELELLKDERVLAVQFSGVITDSVDAPNVENNSFVEAIDKKGDLSINMPTNKDSAQVINENVEEIPNGREQEES